MHRWTLTSLLTIVAGLAAWLAPRGATVPAPVAHTPPAPALPTGPDQDGPLTLDLALDAGAVLRDAPTTRYVVATVKAPAEESGNRVPVDLALVLDVSGSMSGAGKIEQARRAAHAVMESLGAEDRVALVSFEDRARRLSALGRPGVGLQSLVDGLSPGGGTNLSDGLLTGFDALGDASDGRVRKVLLMTDGQANQGVTSPEALAQLTRQPGLTVSTVGVGYDYNERLLASMADAGGGGYHYVDANSSLATVFEQELHQAAHLVTASTRLDLELAPGVTATRVLGWEAQLTGGRVAVDLGALPAGTTRTVVVEVEVTAGGQATRPVASATLSGTGAGDAARFAEHATTVATTVADASDVPAYVSPSAMKTATAAVAGDAVVAANQAYREGDAERGRARLKDAARWVRRQSSDYNLGIPEASSEKLKRLGYLDDADAQKSTLSEGRDLSRGASW